MEGLYGFGGFWGLLGAWSLIVQNGVVRSHAASVYFWDSSGRLAGIRVDDAAEVTVRGSSFACRCQEVDLDLCDSGSQCDWSRACFERAWLGGPLRVR